jgi:hypothetical protein
VEPACSRKSDHGVSILTWFSCGFELESSQKVRRSIDAHGAVPALVAILQARNVPQLTKERVNSVAFHNQSF